MTGLSTCSTHKLSSCSNLCQKFLLLALVSVFVFLTYVLFPMPTFENSDRVSFLSPAFLCRLRIFFYDTPILIPGPPLVESDSPFLP